MSLSAADFVTRPIQELFGRHPGYGFAGVGVSTAIGNYTETDTDLAFSSGLLGLLDWTRTYNSRSDAEGALGRGWTTAFSAQLVTGAQGTVAFHDEDGRVLIFTPASGGGFTRPQDLTADLARSSSGDYTLTFNCGEVWSFDSAGRLASRAREGQTVSLDYDSAGRLLRAAQSFGLSLSLSYGAAGRLAEVQASDGRTVSYGYASDGTLATVTVPGGGVTTYASSGGLISRVTTPDGDLAVANEYDASGRVAHQDFPAGGGADFGYGTGTGLTTVTSIPSAARGTFQADANGRLTQLTDAAGNSATFGYDPDGQLTQATTPGGVQQAWTYDSRGNVLTSTSGGATNTLVYDSADRLISATDAAGATTTLGYTGASYIPTRVTDANGGVTLVSQANGLITGQTDPDGNISGYNYDAAGNLASVTDPLGQVTSFGYDNAGNRSRIASPSGATATYTHDGAGRLVTATDAAGAVTAYRYSANGFLIEQTDPTGAVTSYQRDAAGLITSITDPLGRVSTFGYDADGNLITATDPAGNVTRSSYDAMGRAASVTDPMGAVYAYTYDPDGRVLTEQGPSGTMHISYDTRGNPVSVTLPAGGTAQYEYDAVGRLVKAAEPGGVAWQTAYDRLGNAISSTDPLHAVTEQAWTAGGQLASVTDALGRQTSYTHDKRGGVVAVTDPEGGVARCVYNADGRRISMVTPAGLVTGCAYDAAGRLISTTDPRGWITRYEYNKRGDKTAVICPSGAVTSYRYDAAGQLTEIIDANGSVTQYRYDSAGNVSSIADAKGAVIRYAYDGARRLTAVTDPLGRTTSYGYDAAGNLTEITDPSGRAMHLAYDADGRLVQKTADNAVSVSYTYNGIGQRISMTDGTGITRYSYDAAGRLVTVTEPDGAETTAGYDAAGQRTSLSYPGGLVVDYGYDGNGRLTSLRDSRSGAAAYALDADGRLLTEQLPGRHSRRYHYLGGLLHEFAVFRDDHAVMTTSLAHDPDGRIASQCDRDHVRDYRYDPVGQLISIVRRQRAPGTAARRPESEAHELHIVYDVVGNRIRLKEGSRETHYSCDVADQLLATETAGRRTEFSYDSSGRLTGRSEGGRRTVIEYDGFGQPATVTQTVPGMTEKVRPTFNGDRLVTALVVTRTNERAEDEHSASVRYIWGGVKQIPQILSQHAATDLDDAERDHRAEVAADFSYGYGRTFVSSARDAAHEAGTFYRDVFGSAIRTEETEDWVQAAGYDAFGAPEASGAPGDDGRRLGLPRFGYRGELADGDLTYLRARSYDATLGRFTSPDPLSASARPSQIENPYPYCANDPLNLTDPLGKFILVPGGYGGNTTLNPWSKITTLHAAENLNWQQALLGKLVPNIACGTSSGDCWASDSFITAAVNYATQAGVDPALVLAIAMKESSGRSATIGALPNEILNQLGVFCHNESPINCWPRPGGASLGFTNIKPATFNLVQNAFPAQFRGVQWANLVGNANLDIKTTAYYLKFIDESVIPSASLPIEQRYTPTQVIEGVYNLGIQNYNTYVVPAGKFGPMVTGYINSIAPDYALARNLICGIGAYTCSGGGWQQESAPTIPPFISPLGPSVPVGPGGGTLYQA